MQSTEFPTPDTSTAPCLLRVARTVVGSSPESPAMLAIMSAGTWIKKARLQCWPLYSQQVLHKGWIWGSHKWESMQMDDTLALKPRTDVTRSPKQGYQWPHEKDLCPPKFLKKSHHTSGLVWDNQNLLRSDGSLNQTHFSQFATDSQKFITVKVHGNTQG